MSDIVIVALPEEYDYVNKISSEKVPHLTLMYLGDKLDDEALPGVVQYLHHVCKTSMRRFGLSVDRRGTLGDKNADVLFFQDGWQTEDLKDVIGYLLANDAISNAYNQAKKFPNWVPHLTLGYPDNPAKEDNRDYPGINYVNFNRIAIWVDDSEGPEFPLKGYSDMEIAMSSSEIGESFSEYFFTEDTLAHYGVKGMKWGVRRDRTPTGVEVKETPGRPVKTKGGRYEKPSEDAKRTAIQRQKARSSSTDSLSNQELKQLVERMQLEANYDRLMKQRAGSSWVQKMFTNKDHREKSIKNLEGLHAMGKSAKAYIKEKQA